MYLTYSINMDMKILSVCIMALAVLAVAFAGCTGTQPSAPTATATPAAGTDNPTAAATEVQTAAPTTAVAGKNVYIIGVGKEHPPYFYIDKEGNPHGFNVDAANWIAENQDFEVEFRLTEWDEIISELLEKKIDIAFSDMRTDPDNTATVSSPDVYWLTEQDVVVKNGSTLTVDDLTSGKVKIATQRGCTADTWIRTDLITTGVIDASKLALYDNILPALDALENGTVDAVIYYKPLVRKSIEGRNFDVIGTIDTEEFYGIGIRNEDTELLEKINAGHMNLQSDPKWAELVGKHDTE